MLKQLFIVLAIVSTLCVDAAEVFGTEPVGPSPVKAFEDLTGEDWAGLSEAEKNRFIYTAIGGLERQGVFIMRSPQEYFETLDKVLAADASLKSEFLDNLFVFCVYDGEPQTREAIRRIREEARSTQGA